MNTTKRRNKIIKELKNREYRDAFAVEHIDTGIPFQVRALREQRGWTQDDLGRLSGMAQEAISRIEDPNYGKLTLNTLKKLRSAFDLGLMVKLVPFSELVEWELNLSPESLEAPSFDDDPYFKEKTEKTLNLMGKLSAPGQNGGQLIYINQYKQNKQTKNELLKKLLHGEKPNQQKEKELLFNMGAR